MKVRCASRQAAATKRKDCQKTRADFKKRKTVLNSGCKIFSESTIPVCEVDDEFYFVAMCYIFIQFVVRVPILAVYYVYDILKHAVKCTYRSASI